MKKDVARGESLVVVREQRIENVVSVRDARFRRQRSPRHGTRLLRGDRGRVRATPSPGCYKLLAAEDSRRPSSVGVVYACLRVMGVSRARRATSSCVPHSDGNSVRPHGHVRTFGQIVMPVSSSTKNSTSQLKTWLMCRIVMRSRGICLRELGAPSNPTRTNFCFCASAASFILAAAEDMVNGNEKKTANGSDVEENVARRARRRQRDRRACAQPRRSARKSRV